MNERRKKERAFPGEGFLYAYLIVGFLADALMACAVENGAADNPAGWGVLAFLVVSQLAAMGVLKWRR